MTKGKIWNTKRGKEYREYSQSSDDYPGHGAIRWYYNLEGRKEKECNDFSRPDNFPKEIVKAIKRGQMRGLGNPIDLLSKSATDDYNARRKLLDDDYNARRKPLDDDYNARCKPLADDYYARRKPLDDDYYARCKPLDDDYNARRKLLDDDYNARCNNLFWDLFAIQENRNPLWRD